MAKQIIKISKKDIEKAVIDMIFNRFGKVVCNRGPDGRFSDNPLNLLNSFEADIEVMDNKSLQ
jgi:hypothetical protein